jgi:hypothetical protein
MYFKGRPPPHQSAMSMPFRTPLILEVISGLDRVPRSQPGFIVLWHWMEGGGLGGVYAGRMGRRCGEEAQSGMPYSWEWGTDARALGPFLSPEQAAPPISQPDPTSILAAPPAPSGVEWPSEQADPAPPLPLPPPSPQNPA